MWEKSDELEGMLKQTMNKLEQVKKTSFERAVERTCLDRVLMTQERKLKTYIFIDIEANGTWTPRCVCNGRAEIMKTRTVFLDRLEILIGPHSVKSRE